MSEVVEKTAGSVVTSENLVEWNMNRLGLATDDAPAEAETVEETPESEPVEAQGESEPDQEPETKATEERKQNPKLEKRFSELTKARKQAEEIAAKAQADKEALEERLRQYESQPAKQEDPIGEEPQASQFTDAFEYAKALAEWSAEKALFERDQQEAQRKIIEQQEALKKRFAEKIEKAKAELPDFDDLVASSQIVISDEIRDAILESDVGPQILYHLASEDEYAQKLSQMPLVKALREIGKLEGKFEAPADEPKSKPVVQKSKAPAPISPIKGTGNAEVITTDTDKLTYAQYKELRKARRIR